VFWERVYRRFGRSVQCAVDSGEEAQHGVCPMKQFEVRLPRGDLIEGLSDQDVIDLARSGRLTGDSLIRQQGHEGWRLVKSVPQFAAHSPTSPTDPPLTIPAAAADIPTPAVVPTARRFSRSMFIGVVAGLMVALLSVAGTAAWYLLHPVKVPEWAELLEADPDPEVVTLESLRSAIRATGHAWRVKDKGTGIEMMMIPPGTFQMGCSASNVWECGGNEDPVHTVTLTNAFYIGRYEITQAQWTARMGSNPSYFASESAQVSAGQVPNRPVEQVSWDMVQGFLAATGMRLPTEAEWEYAYRAGTNTAFHSMPNHPTGTNDVSLLGLIAWFRSNANDQTHPVGQKAGNGFGLHDMAGNVLEWVNDWFSSSYYATSPSINPPGPSTGPYRVLRGGSWSFNAHECRSSGRSIFDPSYSTNRYFGFRIARTP
jgi:formylglycine-generating enzyme required for sulfatase activity